MNERELDYQLSIATVVYLTLLRRCEVKNSHAFVISPRELV